MVLVMVRRMILNINITNSQYNPPYHLGRTIMMMMHDTDVDDNDDDAVDDHYKHQHNEFKILYSKLFGDDDYHKEN